MLDGHVVLTAGRTSRANTSTNASVSVLWPAPGGGPYSLIVDGDGTVDNEAEEIAVVPTRAVLHRVAGGPTDLPTCVPLER